MHLSPVLDQGLSLFPFAGRLLVLIALQDRLSTASHGKALTLPCVMEVHCHVAWGSGNTWAVPNMRQPQPPSSRMPPCPQLHVNMLCPAQVAALPCMADDTVFALHAPFGTSLELPGISDPKHPNHRKRDPNCVQRYRCQLVRRRGAVAG